MEIRTDSSQIIVILIACAGIVAFIVYFSARYNWEQSEQRYQELLFRKKSDIPTQNDNTAYEE